MEHSHVCRNKNSLEQPMGQEGNQRGNQKYILRQIKTYYIKMYGTKK